MFQFTHPGRGATSSPSCGGDISLRFNSRTPGGVRHLQLRDHVAETLVSIHAPREGCDERQKRDNRASAVSIHAPREGCDFVRITNRYNYESFNSRTPGGVRRSLTIDAYRSSAFQFTHPGRGATG